MMGANCYTGDAAGVTFRVWAPHALKVAVAGTFNGWAPDTLALGSEGNGFWSADVVGAAANDEYKFVLSDASAGTLWHMDPYVTRIRHSGGALNGVIDEPAVSASAPGYVTPAWNELVIYELHIRTFLPGDGLIQDANGNPIKTGDGSFIGSFQAVTSKLDYLQALGVNAIELLPLGEFMGDISAGYNPAYIFAIEDEYGGPDGFRDFVNEAHKRGIAVIVDVVYNHLGNPAADMWRFDGWSENDKGGIYFYNDSRSKTAWGDTRFDYGRGEVRSYLKDNALRWLQQRLADGLRWDSVGSIRNVNDQNDDHDNDIADGWSLCQWINASIRQSQPWKISIAEDLKENEWITKAGDSGAGFNSQWSSRFVNDVRNSLIPADDRSRDMQRLSDTISQGFNGDAFQRVIFTESHDADSNGEQQRLPEMITPGDAWSWAAKKRSTLGAAILLTAPGIPMLFMGQEFLAAGRFNEDQALDWTNAWRFTGIITLYRDLIRLRRNWFNNTRGLRGQNTNCFHINATDKLIGFHRWDTGGQGDDVVVLLNCSDRAFTHYRMGLPSGGGVWRVRLNSDARIYDEFFADSPTFEVDARAEPLDGLGFSGAVNIGAYTAVILSQDA